MEILGNRPRKAIFALNPHDSGRFCTESLESAAKRYKSLGFSIIPLHGACNPQQPKLPQVKWSRYQHTHPTDHEVAHWFAGKADLGIGIVCGRISQLLVLDIDDVSVASEFRHQLPHLANTLTVKSGTRGLPHFYFRLPVGWLVPTASYPGADLRGEGSYVVAPPTRVNDACWQVEYDTPIQLLTSISLKQILAFLTALKPSFNSRISASMSSTNMAVASEFRHVGDEDELAAWYRHFVSKGRNLSLFKASIRARDSGVTQADAVARLAPMHVSEPGLDVERPEARYREAVQTIASAYSRPRQVRQITVRQGLGTAVREKLLQEGLVAAGRVLDALYTANVGDDSQLTEAQICQVVQRFGIGRRSVMNALSDKFGGQLIIQQATSPRIPPEYANAAHHTDDLNNSCEMSRGAKRVNNRQRGRPARVYHIPMPQDVAKLLGVSHIGHDVVREHELASPRLYRQALHDRLIERRPGAYPREWLSARIGVSRWTTRRYEAALNIQVQPVYVEQVLTWETAGVLPEDSRDVSYGVFVQTSDNKRYPALRGIAMRLLKQGKQPVLKHQQVNHYAPKPDSVGIPTPSTCWADIFNGETSSYEATSTHQKLLSVGIPTPHDNAAMAKPQTENAKQPQPLMKWDCAVQPDAVGIPTPSAEPTFWLCPECLDFHISPCPPVKCATCDVTPIWEVVPPLIWRDAQALKSWWHTRQREYRQIARQSQLPPQPATPKLSAADEVWVGKLQASVKGLSFANARKLVHQFGVRVVEKALATLQQRGKVRSPAGFLISILRSDSKKLSSNNIDYNKKTNPKSALDWLRRLAQSEYLSFIANAEDILRWQEGGELVTASP